MIRFLHAADLHLGMRITRFDVDTCKRIVEARFAALQDLRDLAKVHKADFVIIAGDVFDDHTIGRDVATRAFEILEGSSNRCPVFIIPGNHDPLAPGGVWDRDPWTREQPHLRVRVLRAAEPLRLHDFPVTLFPCPLTQRRSLDDPTAWIARHPRAAGDDTMRIGIAHGSLNVLAKLPEDDHLIRRDAVDHYGLDYLALGHWHRQQRFLAGDGAERTAYAGTHEPMRFPEAGTSIATGWTSYSADSIAERFLDDGRGGALLVSIAERKSPPRIEPIETGRLRWSAESRDLTGDSIGNLIADYSRRDHVERTILRLVLRGVVDPRAHLRLEELERVVCHRYHPGSELDIDAVLIEPSDEQMQEVVGEGVLRRVLEKLKEECNSTDSTVQRVAGHALKLLYRIAWEEQPQ